jgi:hypothetical protein
MTLSAPWSASSPASPVDWCERFAVSLARADKEQSVQDLTIDSCPLQQPAPVLVSPHVLSPFADPRNSPLAPWGFPLPLLPVLRANQSP